MMSATLRNLRSKHRQALAGIRGVTRLLPVFLYLVVFSGLGWGPRQQQAEATTTTATAQQVDIDRRVLRDEQFNNISSGQVRGADRR